MLEEFEKVKLTETHYLSIAFKENGIYFNEFIKAISNLKEKLSEKEFQIFWNDKIQLNKNTFNEKNYIQGACEIAVANYFLNKTEFKVEVKVNPKNKKDVDCQFKSGKYIYNIEVKCASFDAKEIVQKSDSFKYQTLGRLNNKEELISIISNAIDSGLTNQGKELKVHSELKNMDNNLKDFLESAHQKFNPECIENEVNILLICCDDKADMQSWVGYLTASQGLFTRESYVDKSTYNNVDIVLLTNLYYKHKDFNHKNTSGSWNLNETLNLFIVNPFRAKDKKEGILNFQNEIINYNKEISEFEVPGEAPTGVKESVRIPHFVIDYLENQNGIYLFDRKKTE